MTTNVTTNVTNWRHTRPMTTTYTAINRDRNSWTVNSNGPVSYPITWDCGHKHRSAAAAQKCLDSMGNAACSYHAGVEDSDGNGYDSHGNAW